MILRDPVHGLIAFDTEEASIVVELLATREVQRLRRVRQLGLTSLAYPGAEHTRFAHAIGAAHVMGLLLARLRQLDGDLPFWQRVTSERARDAYAAALLHDLGHGPFSHLFETALEGAPGRLHEAWTEAILLDPGAEVHRVLARRDPQLPRRVAELVRGRGELPYLSRAVSGTFDVDRCDYLLRDAHATGVRYGDFDLPWLLRALRFGPVAGDAAPGLAIDGTKGLTAIESFVLARCFMFQQVYFHKTTRAAERMIHAILRRAVAALADGLRLPGVPPALRTMAEGAEPSLGDYLELDDGVLLSAMHAWEQGPDPVLADLCARLRARALWKTLELFGGPEEEARALEVARDLARARGLEPDAYVALDVAEDVPYEDDASILVLFGDGRAERPSRTSFLLERLAGARVRQARLVFAAELRDELRAALRPPAAPGARGGAA